MPTVTLLPIADAFTDQFATTNNHGTDIWMWCDPDAYIYMMFDIPANSAITAASLNIYQASSPVQPTRIFTTDSSWTELGLNWGNQPAAGTQVATIPVVTSGLTTSTSFTNLNLFPTSGNFSITIRPAASGAGLGEYLSREDDDGFEPKLTITYNEPVSASPYKAYARIIG